MSRSSLFSAACASVACFSLCACEQLLPNEEPPPEPVPSFVVSTPLETRTLLDVEVTKADHTGIISAFAVGTGGVILHYDGVAWTQEPAPVSVDLHGISAFVDGEGFENVFACGQDGVIVRRTGASGGWEVIASNVTEDLFSVWVRRRDDAFFVGDRGRVVRWDGTVMTPLIDEVLQDTGAVDDAGRAIEFPISEPLKSVSGRDRDDVFAVGPRGVVYRFDGDRFRIEDSGTSRPLAHVFTDAGVWAAATDGVLLRRRGGDWNDDEFRAPIPAFLQGIWARNDGDVFAVGLAPEIFHRENGAWTVTSVGQGVAMRAIDGAELPPDPTLPPLAEGEEPPPVQREILAVGAGGRIVRGPLAVPKEGEVALATVPEEDLR